MKSIKNQKAEMLSLLIMEYRIMHENGGNLHIILEDGNYGPDTARCCALDCVDDYWGWLIATILSEFSAEEQKIIVESDYPETIVL